MGFFQDFFGDSQRDDIQNAQNSANMAYKEGLSKFSSTTQEYLDKSLGRFEGLQPTIDQGTGALKLLADALGVSGQDAQGSFFSNFQNDPGYQASLQGGIDALDASANARGQLYSGGQRRDLFSFGQRQMSDQFNNRLAQLFNLGQIGANLGLNEAVGTAGLISNAGDNIANAQFGTNQLFANNAINAGNAMAQSRGVGLNNILGVVNTGVNVAKAAMGIPGASSPTPTAPTVQSQAGGFFNPQIGMYGRV